jgi:hypothetical protein
MRASLVKLEDAGVVEATEERHPVHFHVAVLRQRPEQHIQMAAGEVAPSLTKRSTAKTVKAVSSKSGKRAAKHSKKGRSQAVASP